MRSWIYILLLCLALTPAAAQDLHFSQFYASPLTLNPAETGYFAEDYRIGGNFRQQWPWAKRNSRYNYITYSAYTDFGLLHGKLPNGDWIGAGLVFLYDRAGDGNLNITKLFASGAYHKVLGPQRKYGLSIGVQAGFVQKSINYDYLYFDNQWNDLFFDLGASSGEPNADNTTYFDMAAGIHFAMMPTDKVHIRTGVSFLHLTQPKESFISGDNRLGMRPVASIQGNIRFSDKWHIEPSFQYMFQKKAAEYMLNIMAGYTFQTRGKMDNSTLFFGLSGRTLDAITPVAGFRINKVRFLASYDVNLSSLSNASNGVGGFEMSIVYMGFFPGTPNNRAVPCPRL